jgi:hypothetical protein
MDSISLSAKERSALFALFARAHPMSNPELEEFAGFRLVGASRRKLDQLQLVETTQPNGANRAFVYELTDAGRRWCTDELTTAGPADAKSAERALYMVLAVFGRYMQATGLTFEDVIKASQEPAARVAHELENVESRVLSAYQELAAEPAQFVRLTEFRARLADLPRTDVDTALDRMYRSQRINLIPQSSPRAVTVEDREAAITIGGEDKHLISEGLS